MIGAHCLKVEPNFSCALCFVNYAKYHFPVLTSWLAFRNCLCQNNATLLLVPVLLELASRIWGDLVKPSITSEHILEILSLTFGWGEGVEHG